jgi:hypothetical protein
MEQRVCGCAPRLLTILLVAILGASGSSWADTSGDLPYDLRVALERPLKQKLTDLSNEKNENGRSYRRGTYSKSFRKVDDSTYLVTLHRDTAAADTLTTERMQLTLKKNAKGEWDIASEEVQDSYSGLHRGGTARFYPFGKFSFDRGGMRLSASKGGMFEWYYQNQVAGFVVMAADLQYKYTAPQQQNYYNLQKMIEKQYQADVLFQPELVRFTCDPASCEEILKGSFVGLDRKPPSEATEPMISDETGAPSWADVKLRSQFERRARETRDRRRDNPFADFRRPSEPGNVWWSAAVQHNDKHALGVNYDNWDGYEYNFWVFRDQPGSGPNGTVFGYYSDETLAKTSPHDLEAREDEDARWYEVYSLKGEVAAALEDPEMLHGRIRYGLTLKKELRELPFFVATIRRTAEDKFNNPTLYVNSVQLDGKELTWVRTGAFSGLVLLPEPMKAGTKIVLDMDFDSRAIYKVHHAYSAMLRGGWMPFVRFGDMIDEFELTLRTPSEYTPLGIGRKVSEKVDGDVMTTRWVSDSPVEFPTIIFGKYESDVSKVEAKKADGTPIPVTVFVDEVSMGQLNIDVNSQSQANEFVDAFNTGSRGIRGKQLRPIATQAVTAINYYRDISGLDYPYGELNLVNDPAPALYGQSPSSLIYLGSFVFRGEGTMAGDTLIGGGGANVSKFLKSVVAHEVGHQWWGSRIANANGRNYWFVESLAEYFSALWLEEGYGRKEYLEQVAEWRKRILEIDQKVSVQNASVLWGGEFPGAAYQAAVYNKGPYAFHILRSTFGDEKFFASLKAFCQKLAEKREIVTMDIQNVAEEAFGGVDASGNRYNANLGWLFDQWIRGVGIPQYSFHYATRRAEDKSWVVEGTIKQRVVVGNQSNYQVLAGQYYRGLGVITVRGRDGKDYPIKLKVEGASTPFAFKVPVEPATVTFNGEGELLALDVLVNQDF